MSYSISSKMTPSSSIPSLSPSMPSLLVALMACQHLSLIPNAHLFAHALFASDSPEFANAMKGTHQESGLGQQYHAEKQTLEQRQGDVPEQCACSPTKYDLRLLFDLDCSSSTLVDSTEGIDLTACFIGLVNTRPQTRRTTAVNDLPDEDWEQIMGQIGLLQDDTDRPNDLFEKRKEHSRTDLSSHGRVRKAQEENEEEDLTPTAVTSILFIEVDTSGELTVINQDSTYFDTFLRNNATITYESVASQLDPSKPLEDQMEYYVGGAGMIVFGVNGSGQSVRSRFFWNFSATECVDPAIDGTSIGWTVFDNHNRAPEAFCPGAPSSSETSSPSVALTTAPSISMAPTLVGELVEPTTNPTSSPVASTGSPTKNPTLSPIKSPTTDAPSTAAPITNAPNTLAPITMPPTAPSTEKPTHSPLVIETAKPTSLSLPLNTKSSKVKSSKSNKSSKSSKSNTSSKSGKSTKHGKDEYVEAKMQTASPTFSASRHPLFSKSGKSESDSGSADKSAKTSKQIKQNEEPATPTVAPKNKQKSSKGSKTLHTPFSKSAKSDSEGSLSSAAPTSSGMKRTKKSKGFRVFANGHPHGGNKEDSLLSDAKAMKVDREDMAEGVEKMAHIQTPHEHMHGKMPQGDIHKSTPHRTQIFHSPVGY